MNYLKNINIRYIIIYYLTIINKIIYLFKNQYNKKYFFKILHI